MKRGFFARVLPVAGSVLVLLAGLTAMDDDVRAYVAGMFSGAAWSEVNSLGWHAQNAAFVLVQAVKDQSFEYAPLMIFGLAATVLLLFMLRT